MRRCKDYLFRPSYSKEVNHHHLSFGRDSKAHRGVEKREAFRYTMIRACWHEEIVDRLGTEIRKAGSFNQVLAI